MGVINIRVTERNGDVVSVIEVTDDDDLLIATMKGQVVRTPVKDISSIGRATQGVRLIRFKKKGDDEDFVASVGRVIREEGDAEEPVGDDPDAGEPPATPPQDGSPESDSE